MRLTIFGDASEGVLRAEEIAAGFAAAAEAAAIEQGQAILTKALENVHRRTGNLAATGRIESDPNADGIIVSVVFGGEVGIDRMVDYAGFEESLHPYLEPATDAGNWDAALQSAWEVVT